MNSFFYSFPVNLHLDINRERFISTAYVCKFCGSITIEPDIAHRCSGISAPEYLKGDPKEDYYHPVRVETGLDCVNVKFEKVKKSNLEQDSN